MLLYWYLHVSAPEVIQCKGGRRLAISGGTPRRSCKNSRQRLEKTMGGQEGQQYELYRGGDKSISEASTNRITTQGVRHRPESFTEII